MLGNGKRTAAAADPKIKDPEKAARDMYIREWASNNGCSIRVARAYWEQIDD